MRGASFSGLAWCELHGSLSIPAVHPSHRSAIQWSQAIIGCMFEIPGRAASLGRNGNRLPTTRTSASPAGQPTIGMKSRPRQLGSRHGLGPATAGALVGAGRDLISGMGASGGRPVRPGRLCECARAIGTARGGMRSLATSCEDLPQTTIASANRRIEDLTLATRRKCYETTMAVDQVRKRCWGDRRHRSW